MNNPEIKSRIEKLKKEINHHRYQYHVLDQLEISEAALDSLKHELYKLKQENPELITPDSPTQRVEGKVLDKFKKVPHKVTQWSFNDVFSLEEIEDFDKRIKKMAGVGVNIDYTAELKIDGLHVVLTYEKGVLVAGATRGDGKVGEDVTANLKTIESIPLRLEKEVNVIVEGEVWMSKESFDNLNKSQESDGKKLFANPRNAAAGTLRQLDSSIVSKRKLDCFVYDLSLSDSELPKTQKEELEYLKELGFKVNPNYKYCKTIKEIEDFWVEWKDKKDSLDYWLDGVVVKVNEERMQKKLGYTGKAPRWAIAFKFPAEQTTTIVEDIKISIGRLGTLTPLAVLKPVHVAGTIVRHATLHNEDRVKELGLKIGDTVVLQKAGDIIPEIVKVLPGLRKGTEKDFTMPTLCPVCSSPVIRKKGESAIYCTSSSCYAKQKERIAHFVSKKGFNIVGMGPSIVENLINSSLIADPADLFELKEGDIVDVEGFAEKSARNLILEIEKSKRITLGRFLFSLGVRYIGEGTSYLISRVLFNDKKEYSVKDIKQKIQETGFLGIENIEGVGEKGGNSLYQYFDDEKNASFLDELNNAGLIITADSSSSEAGEFNRKTVVITGSLESLSRDDAKERIRSLGGSVSSSVSAKTDFVLVGDSPGSKYEKAKKLGVRIISEEEFLKMVFSHLT